MKKLSLKECMEKHDMTQTYLAFELNPIVSPKTVYRWTCSNLDVENKNNNHFKPSGKYLLQMMDIFGDELDEYSLV